ncbi:helix-turn-helix domain-containing protein [Clostridium beijerinckii]|uniref:helix-turn-helix domain-containing protein n=1 Tax=Clostridium beijerinckii TaxID=1520 RepID=UPI0014940332|nr:AraC family transcriptional regulator [Clostridium beijerinckii]NOW05430.1 AraC-like DNA-binding protein/mannose-6-phosphate isomerase-like protein (cupin superfamily) [Clostridium beijerinckii]NYC01426.1 AraC-like DNA-binding protein/mannose-6-phosphate isomerase-like protein (cupin superfamily) [Clostridium beijerinckii]
MSSYIFETIEHEEKYPAKVFVTSIEHSSFHWHYDYELILVLKGSLIVNASPKITVLEAGDIVLLNSKAVHELQRTKEENLCLFIQMNENLFKNTKDDNRSYYFYLNSKLNDKKPKNGYDAYVANAAKIGLESQSDEIFNTYRVKSLVYMLIADLFEFTLYDIHQKAVDLKETENTELLMQVINFIQKNCTKDTVLDELYKFIGLCEKSVYRFLKANIGLSPKDLVLSSKIEASKYMLKFSNKSISFIANDCGFYSESTFYRAFKKEIGVTPAEYRKSGVSLNADPNVQGYLRFDFKESINLLGKYCKGDM